MAAGLFSAAAHISAVCPFQPSLRVDLGAGGNQLPTTCGRRSAPQSSAPSRRRRSRCSGRPRPRAGAARCAGCPPWRRPAAAPRRSGSPPSDVGAGASSTPTISSLSRWTAQWSAVVPSAAGAFTSAPFRTSDRSADASPPLAAATISGVATARPTAAASAEQTQRPAPRPGRTHQSSSAIEPYRPDNGSIGSRPVLSPSVSAGTPDSSSIVSSRFVIGVSAGNRRWRSPFTPAPDEQQRQVRVGVQVRVAQAGAVQEQRVIEHGAVAVGRRLELLQETREELGLIRAERRVLRQLARCRRRGATARGAPR